MQSKKGECSPKKENVSQDWRTPAKNGDLYPVLDCIVLFWTAFSFSGRRHLDRADEARRGERPPYCRQAASRQVTAALLRRSTDDISIGRARRCSITSSVPCSQLADVLLMLGQILHIHGDTELARKGTSSTQCCVAYLRTHHMLCDTMLRSSCTTNSWMRTK